MRKIQELGWPSKGRREKDTLFLGSHFFSVSSVVVLFRGQEVSSPFDRSPLRGPTDPKLQGNHRDTEITEEFTVNSLVALVS